ncbi:MAG: hypothetical protein ACE5E4_01985 [Candidatus Binatia bacterium]
MISGYGLRLAAPEAESFDLASSPGNRLMLAVLEEALVTFEHGLDSVKAESRRHFFEVDRWIASEDTDSPFSFENICTALMLDADYIRTGLRQKKKLRGSATVRASRRLRRERIYSRRGWRGQISS